MVGEAPTTTTTPPATQFLQLLLQTQQKTRISSCLRFCSVAAEAHPGPSTPQASSRTRSGSSGSEGPPPVRRHLVWMTTWDLGVKMWKVGLGAWDSGCKVRV